MKTIEIPADLYTELLEKALEMNYKTPADVIRFLLYQRKSEIAASDSPSNSINQQLVTKGGPLPNGIKLRAAYKGRTFSATVERGAIVSEGKQFRSPSAAAIYVAKLQGTPNPSINGWKFWEYFDSSTNHWKILENLRDILDRNGGRSGPVPSKGGEEIFVCKSKNADAKGTWRSGKFVVLKGSKANSEETPSQLATNKKIRTHALGEGALRRENGYLIFCRDYPFNSLSTAAGVVLGRSSNGKTEWRRT